MSTLRQLKQALNESNTYQQWLEIATDIDLVTGMTAWRNQKQPGESPYNLLASHTQTLQDLIHHNDHLNLAIFIKESLYRTIGELDGPHLYQQALCGTKKVIEQYLNTVVIALNTLCDHPIPGLSEDAKLTLLLQAEKNFGRPALMLSGGGTFGIFHNGVIKALLDHDLLPKVISGTSMGSITAGILATHHDHEIISLLSKPDDSHYQPLKKLSLRSAWSHKALLDPTQLQECLAANIGDYTFIEAFNKTGREVSITVSPARAGLKPRILNHQTAPNVLIISAAKASCSVPGLFPASQLEQRSPEGKITPYLEGELWVDGSFANDIPRQRISRLNNVNYFIVSQANPHIVPFISHRQKSGITATVKEIVTTSILAQSNTLLKVARRRLIQQPWRSWLNHASLFLDQDYLGDVNIHPNFPPNWYLKFMINPSNDERDYLLKMGEHSTWPKLAIIKDQTLISNTLQGCISRLQIRLNVKTPRVDQTATKKSPAHKKSKLPLV
jgi:predicted acylesterase/phospholipase RssA